MKITYQKLIAEIKGRFGFELELAKDVVDYMFDYIAKNVNDEKHVYIKNFGHFYARRRRTQKAFDFKTNTTIDLEFIRNLRFKPAAKIKKDFNNE